MTRFPVPSLRRSHRGGHRHRDRCSRAASAVRAGHPGDAAQAQSRRLADVQPHLRRAAVQPAEADQPAERRPAEGSVQEGAGQRPAREHPDRLPRRDVSAAARRRACRRSTPPPARSSGSTGGRAAPRAPRRIAIYEDMVYYTSPDGFIVALDARTGEVRWETKTTRRHDGRRRSSSRARSSPAARARRAATTATSPRTTRRRASELWRFYTAAGSNEPGGDTWGGAPDATRRRPRGDCPAATTRCKRLVYWGVANPTPNTRANRHGGQLRRAIGLHGADRSLQQLDHRAEPRHRQAGVVLPAPARRRLGRGLPARAHADCARRCSPDPKFVKWINPDVKKGEPRDIALMVGEGGGIFALDRGTGQFLWASPFPFDTPNFLISNIDGKTGRVDHQQGRDVHRPAGSQGDLLLEHAQLLAHGLSSRASTRCSCPTSRTAST